MQLRSILYSILIHLGVAGLLFFSIGMPVDTIKPQRPSANIVNAVAVDEQKVQEELERLKEKEQQKQKAEQQRRQELKEIEQRRKSEEQRLAELRKKQAQEEQQREKENQRLAELKKKQEELERRRELEEKKKREAEKERERIEKEKQEALAEKKRIEEQKRQAELEKERIEEARRREEEERRRREAEQALKEQLEAEQRAAEEAQKHADQKVIDQYGARIQEAIRRQFNTVGLPEDLSCVLQIRTVPGGDVVEVRVVQSSGNSIFDRRAETAVNKASPLPVPDNMRIFEKMREIRLTFAPQG